MKIDGRKIAEEIFEELRLKAEKLRKRKIIPNLAIILVGNDPASVAYVNQKKLKGEGIGAKITIKHFSNSISQSNLLSAIQRFNNAFNVHGIIVQQPLPSHINIEKITQAIDPKKDVDGFHTQSKFESPIAAAVLEILKVTSLKSKKIVIVGKGETGGKLIIRKIKKMGIEPIVIDSKTKKTKDITKNADIIISAVGKPQVIKPNMLKRGVILISIGLHKRDDNKLHGDYEEDQVKNIASFYTPTPGGVGPVNVAMLLKNLITAGENSVSH